jgi:hypothetical protein
LLEYPTELPTLVPAGIQLPVEKHHVDAALVDFGVVVICHYEHLLAWRAAPQLLTQRRQGALQYNEKSMSWLHLAAPAMDGPEFAACCPFAAAPVWVPSI